MLIEKVLEKNDEILASSLDQQFQIYTSTQSSKQIIAYDQKAICSFTLFNLYKYKPNIKPNINAIINANITYFRIFYHHCYINHIF